MEKQFRKLLLLSFCALPFLSIAQKENWTFSDRTGIKGIQFSVGPYQLRNVASWKYMLPGYVKESWTNDSAILIKYPFSQNMTIPQLEVVYAPFRFSMNPWLRNLEILGGISHRSFDHKIRSNWGGSVDENNYQYFDRSYYLRFSHTAAHVRVAVNRSVSPSFMLYGSAGLGMGISSGLTIESSEIIESYYSYDSTDDIYNKTNLVSPGEVFYQSKGIRQQSLGLGLKFYVSCRINLYAEFGMEFLQIHAPGRPTYYQNSYGFQVGLRFKFNPPEAKEDEEDPKDKNVFW